MKEIVNTRIRVGYRRVNVMLKREEWQVGRSQAYRLYRQEQLQLRSKPTKRRKMLVQRQQRIQASAPGQVWTMDFVADELGYVEKSRMLTMVDGFTCEA